jgi:hypothetical protein
MPFGDLADSPERRLELLTIVGTDNAAAARAANTAASSPNAARKNQGVRIPAAS